mgnify:FL=1
MFKKKYDLAIINRSFWPVYPVVGEGLLRLAESQAKNKKVIVYSQGKEKLSKLFSKYSRGQQVDSKTFLKPAKSNSSLLKRIAESIFFMFWVLVQLIRTRPKVVYISTDPPIVVPFIVSIYSRVFRAQYIYHLQDIHPEITSIYLKKNSHLFKVVKALDNFTLRRAKKVLVLSDEMKRTIQSRTALKGNVEVIANPAIDITQTKATREDSTLAFCGNAGRLQRIPLLIEAISEYLDQGGKLKFEFIGSGVYSDDLQRLSETYSGVTFHGFLPPDVVANMMPRYAWGFVPLEDEVIKYAFPSKTSSYAASGVPILAVCGNNTSLARWVNSKEVGLVVEPSKEKLLSFLNEYEKGNINFSLGTEVTNAISKELSFDVFVTKLNAFLEETPDDTY